MLNRLRSAQLARWAAFPALLLAAHKAPAQFADPGSPQQLLHKTYFLRGCWGGSDLAFDGAGQPVKDYDLVPFATDAIEITRVQQNGRELDLEGRRVGLEFDRSGAVTPIAIRSGGHGGRIRLRIAASPDGSFDEPLKAILAGNLAEVPSASVGPWQTYAARHWGKPADAPATTGPSPEAALGIKPGNGVTPPKVIHQEDPRFNDAARSVRHSGSTDVTLFVGTDGVPADVQILRPTGLGLDEAAAAAVSNYRFTPAAKDGDPVPVNIYVDVNFRIY